MHAGAVTRLCLFQELKAQEVLTLEKALQFAETGSPDITAIVAKPQTFSEKP